MCMYKLQFLFNFQKTLAMYIHIRWRKRGLFLCYTCNPEDPNATSSPLHKTQKNGKSSHLSVRSYLYVLWIVWEGRGFPFPPKQKVYTNTEYFVHNQGCPPPPPYDTVGGSYSHRLQCDSYTLSEILQSHDGISKREWMTLVILITWPDLSFDYNLRDQGPITNKLSIQILNLHFLKL